MLIRITTWWLRWSRIYLQCRRPRFSPLVGKIPWRRLPTPVFLPGEFQGWSNLAGYSPWGCKEQDMTKQLKLSLLYKDITLLLVIFSTLYIAVNHVFCNLEFVPLNSLTYFSYPVTPTLFLRKTLCFLYLQLCFSYVCSFAFQIPYKDEIIEDLPLSDLFHLT